MAAGLLVVLAVTAFAKPAEARPPAKPPKGKIAVFPVLYDDDNGFSGQLQRLLRARGLEVSTDVRRVDTAEQFRELSTALGIGAYVDAELTAGPTRSRLTVVVRSGYTGKKVAVAIFKETNLHLRAEVEDKLWSKIGPAIERACADASKPRERDRAPMVVEAGEPLADK
jgi:ActR/RegA family two-component response regulator